MPGPPPRGDRAAPPAERPAAYRARRKATPAAAVPTKAPVIVRYRRPADRRSRPHSGLTRCRRWQTHMDQFQEWRDNLPPSLANGATAKALDAVLKLRGCVEELQAAELPKGFGRD
jgi:hypothetical protein